MSVVEGYPKAPAVALIGDLKARKVSSAELVETAIGRIERYDGAINAVVVRDFDRAREAARAQDALIAKGEGGPLAGLPMTVKESYNLEGYPTTWGMVEFSQTRAQTAALAVQRLRAAGAVILGKTNVPPVLADWQSANPVYGRTNNPYDLSRSPGGSSGGSAAAVAAGYVALEFGSDIGGSIRIPAAFCGVFGHKPSYALVPMIGHAPGTVSTGAPPPMSVSGPLARSADDLRLALSLTAGPAPDEAAGYRLDLKPSRHARLGDFRVLVLDRHPKAAVDGEILAVLDGVVKRLEAAGAKVGRADPDLPDLISSHKTYLALLSTVTQRRNPNPARDPISAFAWLDAVDAQFAVRKAWARVFERWDIVLAPTLGAVAFPHIEDNAPDWRNRRLTIDGQPTPYGDQLVWPGIANLANLPATAFPAGMTKSGLPIGLQAMGPYLEDLTPIAFAGLAAVEIPSPALG